MRQKIKYMALMVMVILITSLISSSEAKASEEIKANQLISIGTDTDVTESPDDDSKVVGNLTSGTSVIAVEEPDNGWINIKYQNIVGYIHTNVIVGQDTAELDNEFDKISNDNRQIFQMMEYNITQNRQKLIWGIVIGGLVIALFIVGIITGVNNSKKGKK